MPLAAEPRSASTPECGSAQGSDVSLTVAASSALVCVCVCVVNHKVGWQRCQPYLTFQGLWQRPVAAPAVVLLRLFEAGRCV
jgi:hypothetical protein